MIVAQLSDLHFMPPGELHFGIDTAATTRAAVGHLNALDPRPDAVVVTGDIADSGTREQYEEARGVLDRLRSPYYVVPVVRNETLAANPKMADVLNRASALLDEATLAEMSYKVDGEKMEPRDVAHDFLKAKGIVR